MASSGRIALRRLSALEKAIRRSSRSSGSLEHLRNDAVCCGALSAEVNSARWSSCSSSSNWNESGIATGRWRGAGAHDVSSGFKLTNAENGVDGPRTPVARGLGIGYGRYFSREVERQADASASSSPIGAKPDNVSVDEEASTSGDGTSNSGPGALQVPQLESMLKQLSEEESPDHIKIAMISLRLGQEYEARRAAPDKVLEFANRALNIFEDEDEDSVEVGMCLHLIAAVYHQMGKHDRCLMYLSRAQKILENKHSSEYSALKFAVYFLFGNALTAKGMFEEALSNYCIGVSIQETILEAGHPQLGGTFRHLAQAYAQVMQFKEAIDYANRALDIHVKNHGPGSMEEAADRRLLSALHGATQDYSTALDHQKRVQDILKANNYGPEKGYTDIAVADLQFNLGKYDDVISSLTAALSELVPGSLVHSLASVSLAKAYVRKRRKGEAKELCDRAVSSFAELGDLDHDGMIGVAQGFSELAAIYEMMDEPNDALEALKQSLSLSERVPGQIHAVAGTQAQIGMLLLFVGKVDEALPYMQGAAAKLRESLGQNHHALALVLNQLGVANTELERIDVAVGHFEESKNILLNAYGPDHDDTLAVFQNLVGAYTVLERWDKALECQQHIVNEWTKLGQETSSTFREAMENLEGLKEKVGQLSTSHSSPDTEEGRAPQTTSARS